MLKIVVPATSANLGPGFDSLGLALGLYNTIEITPSVITSVQITGEGKNSTHLRTHNVFVKIFNQILARYNVRAECKFLFHNEIPVARGLGSSSAVIVSAIYAAFLFMNRPIDKQEILNIAIEYEKHPDNVTPAVFGGFNVAILEYNDLPRRTKIQFRQNVVHIHAPIPSEIRAVVVVPNKSMNTKLSRKALPKLYNAKDCVFNLSHASLLSAAFLTHDWDKLAIASRDKLHQNARMKNFPILFKIQSIALQNGALLSTLSGSGSSILSICHAQSSKHLAQILSQHFPKYKVLELGFDNEGVRRVQKV